MLHSLARYARVNSRVHRVGQDLQTATAIPARAVVQGVPILFNARRSEVCQATRVDYPSTLPGVC